MSGGRPTLLLRGHFAPLLPLLAIAAEVHAGSHWVWAASACICRRPGAMDNSGKLLRPLRERLALKSKKPYMRA